MTAASPKGKKKASNPIMRFAGIGLQMAILITAGALGGRYIDEKTQNEKPIWSVVGSLIGVGIGLFLVIREAIRLGKDE